MDQHRERDVARGLRQGKSDAWRALYDAHAERVWRLVARLMEPGATDVADVVQETFLAAARSARSYDPGRGALGVWLSGIARNHVALHYRKQRRQQRIRELARQETDAREQVVRWLDSRELEPPDALAAAELATLVRATLSELSVDYEGLLVAKYVDGASIEQIATAEDASAEAIRSKLARARRAFRRAFSQTGTPSSDAIAGGDHES